MTDHTVPPTGTGTFHRLTAGLAGSPTHSTLAHIALRATAPMGNTTMDTGVTKPGLRTLSSPNGGAGLHPPARWALH
ncbi:hypothetical protein CSOJ01_02399 [Colletotrichum sojae]|uniref:Uncharacterized protein n=1 Tax=Colletotrichum sojae TaxID=2175907 RepID=A0A8H6JR15_9PEZI|nr:hypothetical protein CSOJ01_02399 [Colletotrichum sojae]